MRISFLAAAALVTSCASIAPVRAQDLLAGFRGGAFVIYGNYCGIGQRGENPRPIDQLDTACMHHDACTPTVGLPACACNDRLHDEAYAAARIARDDDEVRNMALLVGEAATMMPCQ